MRPLYERTIMTTINPNYNVDRFEPPRPVIENNNENVLAALIEIRDKIVNKGLHSFDMLEVIRPINLAILQFEIMIYNKKNS